MNDTAVGVPAGTRLNGAGDCWNRIGIRGDRSCAELARHTHCRNCPAFSSAAIQRLDRPLNPEERDEWTQLVARPLQEQGVRGESVLVFRLGAEWLALPTRVFREVAEVVRPHVLPYRRFASAVGLVNVRGDLVVHISLVELLRIRDTERWDATTARGCTARTLVVGDASQKIAFTADEVCGVHRVDVRTIRPVPSTLARSSGVFTTGVLQIDSRTVSLLDAERVLGAMASALA